MTRCYQQVPHANNGIWQSYGYVPLLPESCLVPRLLSDQFTSLQMTRQATHLTSLNYIEGQRCNETASRYSTTFAYRREAGLTVWGSLRPCHCAALKTAVERLRRHGKLRKMPFTAKIS